MGRMESGGGSNTAGRKEPESVPAAFGPAADVYLLIAGGNLYVDLNADPLAEPRVVQLFPDRTTARSPAAHVVQPATNFASSFQTLRAGATISWDGRPWRIANIGDSKIALLHESGEVLELGEANVESLIREDRIKQSGSDHRRERPISDRLIQANEEDLTVANHRAVIVRRRLSGDPALNEQVTPRTLRR